MGRLLARVRRVERTSRNTPVPPARICELTHHLQVHGFLPDDVTAAERAIAEDIVATAQAMWESHGCGGEPPPPRDWAPR